MTYARMEVKANNQSFAKPHAEYIMGLGKYAKKQNEIQCTKSGNMPEWAKENPLEFWRASDEYERANGNKYREHLISLPRELSPQEREQLIDDWIKQELGDKHAYTYAIHVPKASDGGEQPHCHLMFSDRINDGIERPAPQYFKRYNAKNPEKGGCKKNNPPSNHAQRVKALQEQKERMQSLMNAILEPIHNTSVKALSSRESRGLDTPAPTHIKREQYQANIRRGTTINRPNIETTQSVPVATAPKTPNPHPQTPQTPSFGMK